MILIKVTTEQKRFVAKCLKYHIALHNISEKDDGLYVKVANADLDNIIRLNYYSHIEIIRYYGLKGFYLHWQKFHFDYFLLIFFFLSLYFISHIMIGIDISHESQELRAYVQDILYAKGIKPFTYAKNQALLNHISEEIISEHQDHIDWLSINRVGMQYKVSFEERIINPAPSDPGTCHIVAKRDGVITKIIAEHGESQVEVGLLVHKGDILVSGQIMLNEEIKDNVCAKGEVYAETWYQVHVKVPLNYEEKQFTKRKRYNFLLNNNYFYKKNYPHYQEEKIFSFTLFNTNFKIVRQQEYVLTAKQYTKEEALALAKEEGARKTLEKSGTNSRVLNEKVLKETINNSTIELDIFYAIEEQIGIEQKYKVGETHDTP